MKLSSTQLAKKYHSAKDAVASRNHHSQVDVGAPSEQNEERHGSAGDIIKSVVLGGLDGIITTFAIVCAVSGSGQLGAKVVIMMGVANLVADAISMGLGDYLSERAENDYVAKEQEREQWKWKTIWKGKYQRWQTFTFQRGFPDPMPLKFYIKWWKINSSSWST